MWQRTGKRIRISKEVVSKRPLEEFLRCEILEKLQLTETFFQVPLDKAVDLAALYKREPWHGSSDMTPLAAVSF